MEPDLPGPGLISPDKVMAGFDLGQETKLRILLIFLIPGFLVFMTWKSQTLAPVQPPTSHDSTAQTEKYKNPITFATFPASPGQEIWQTTSSGLKYFDLAVGQGPSPQLGQRVAFLYVVRLQDGKVIASNTLYIDTLDIKKNRMELLTYVYGYTPFPAGWTEAVSTMKVGGWRRFILPPNLAYGSSTLSGAIPSNATLVIDAQLLYLDQTIRPKDLY